MGASAWNRIVRTGARAHNVGASKTGFFDPIGPTQESKDTYADLEVRWQRIETCLVIGGWPRADAPDSMNRCKWPKTASSIGELRHNTAPFYAKWIPFRDRWRSGDFDLPDLAVQVTNLTQAEREMNAGGADIRDAPKPAPGIEDRSIGLQAADKTDRAAMASAEAVQAASDSVADIAKKTGGFGIAGLWDAVPLGVKVAGAAVAGVVVLTQVASIIRNTR